MKIELINDAESRELPPKGTKVELFLYNNILRCTLGEKEYIKLEQNGESYELNNGIFDIPLEMSDKNQNEITVHLEKKVIRYHFSLNNVHDLEKDVIRNLLHFATNFNECFLLDEEYPVADLIHEIKTGSINLLVVKEPVTGFDDENFMHRIAEVIPMIMDICSHPKQSLKVEEAVMDVSMLKRINSNTMKHLASHSEHWKARTLNGLIPSRLKADIFEDDINIYENLFFRMAVDDILRYVSSQISGLEKAIHQNQNKINWDKYSVKLNDYKRMEILNRLIPEFDVTEGIEKNENYLQLLKKWNRLGRQLSNVKASGFYRRIDKKQISRNIYPTNILKKDSRYNALFRLWNDICTQITREKLRIKKSSDEITLNISYCYALYVVVMLIYIFDLMDMKAETGSVFCNSSDGLIHFNGSYEGKTLRYLVKTSVNKYKQLEIGITFLEKMDVVFQVPHTCVAFVEDKKEELPKGICWDISTKEIHFYRKPTDDEQKEMLKLLRINQSSSKGMDKDLKRQYTKADKEWRESLNAFIVSGKLRNPKEDSICIKPQIAVPKNDEAVVESYTRMLLENTSDGSVYVFPIEVDTFGHLENEAVIWRMINYGEKYAPKDAELWGNYRKGMFPVDQSEIYSVQRFIKLIAVHTSRLLLQWNGEQQEVCPGCGMYDCQKIDGETFKCKNSECGILFGKTKCADGCGQYYEWTRPNVEVDEEDLQFESPMELMLAKESIFDRLTITDFDFVVDEGKIKYYPVCPKCGKRK